MAQYQDIPVPSATAPDDVYGRITNYLLGASSVEVIPYQDTVILRVWFDQHCDPAQHQRIP